MKRGTPGHPKILALAVALDVPEVVVVGLLEKLWHWAARYAAQGDIGKWPDEVIEKEAGWRDFVARFPDKRAASVATESRLIDALVATRWLDRHDSVRLYIHDWHDHCDDASDKYLVDKGLQYALGHETRRKPKVATESRPSRDRVAINGTKSQGSHTHTHTQDHTHSPDEGACRDSVVEDPEPERKEFEGVNGAFRAVFRALRATGKMDQLTYEHVAQVAQEYPLAQLHEESNYREIVLELKGVAGNVGTALPWLRSATSRLEERRIVEAQKKEKTGGGDDPRSRRIERAQA